MFSLVPILLGVSWGGASYAWLSPAVLGPLAFGAAMLVVFLAALCWSSRVGANQNGGPGSVSTAAHVVHTVFPCSCRNWTPSATSFTKSAKLQTNWSRRSGEVSRLSAGASAEPTSLSFASGCAPCGIGTCTAGRVGESGGPGRSQGADGLRPMIAGRSVQPRRNLCVRSHRDDLIAPQKHWFRCRPRNHGYTPASERQLR